MIEDWMLISFHSLHIIYQIVYQDVSRVLTLSLDFQMCLCCLSLSFIENDLSLYTLLFLKWITNKNLLCSTWNSAQCYAPAWMRRGSGGEWTDRHVWLSPFTVHLKLSQHGLLAIPQYKIKSILKSLLSGKWAKSMEIKTRGSIILETLMKYTKQNLPFWICFWAYIFVTLGAFML